MDFTVLYNLIEYGSGLALAGHLTVWADDSRSGLYCYVGLNKT